MALIGYARVSTADQNLGLQGAALAAVECIRVFTDKTSSGTAYRPGLADALEYLREGDTLVVWKLDRLGRNVGQLVALMRTLEGRGVNFRSLTENIDTSTTAGRFYFHIVASFAQMERELMIERTKAGLDAARKAGRIGGRRTIFSPRKIQVAYQLFSDGNLSAAEIAHTLGVSVTTLYRHVPASARQIALFPENSPPMLKQ